MNPTLLALACTMVGTAILLASLIWRLSALATEMKATSTQLANDVQRIEKRLVQLDAVPLLQRAVEEMQSAISSVTSRLLALERENAEHRGEQRAEMRRSRGEFQ